MSSSKKKIRDLERMLKRKGSDESVELRIKNLKEENLINVQREKERNNALKYHMVKFIERKKVTRKIRAIDTELLNANKKKSNELQSHRLKLLDDLEYIMYYPNDMKYIALYVDNSSEDGNNGDISTNKLRERARAHAKKHHEDDIEKGINDKVLHAIKVSNNPGNKSSNNNKNNSNKDENDDDGYDSDNVDDEDSKSIDIKYKPATTKSNNKVKNKDSTNNKIATIEKNKNETLDNSEQSLTKSANNDFEPDMFFMEEAGLAIDGDNKEKKMNNKKAAPPKRYGQSWSKKTVDTVGMSKQELRLIQWQQKPHSGRGFKAAPIASNKEFKPINYENNNSNNNNNNIINNNNDSNKRNRVMHEKKDNKRTPQHIISNGNIVGVSAASMTDAVKRKNTGTIIDGAPKGKVVKFD